jgi:valyl-tRNA synthetase
MINKNYDSKKIEAHWRKQWEMHSYFQPSGKGEPYCIVLPPPNVTGSLHMGHGFQVTLMDALSRYQRMCGKNVLWQGGTDHAGIATQMVVERQLLAQGKSRHDLGRDALVEAIWEWKNKSGGRITEQLRYLGASIDWTRERFTRDTDFSAAVEKVFIDLYKQGLIYRGKRLVNWDPQLLTAVSDLEVINQEEKGHLWTIRYPLTDNNSFLCVATTRPETLFGDAAVAVHPDDPHYQSYIGKQVKIPLTDRVIPIITDPSVDPAFGSGCVKITPAHDFNDYATGERHHLTSINIFTPNAHLNEKVPKKYQGLERYVARKKILKDLEHLGLLEKKEDYLIKIPRGDRSGVVIEPYLTDQWFISMQPLASSAIPSINQKELGFIPETWRKVCLQWLENIEDWCISRQLWWGHRIPAWYDEQGQIYVGKDEKTIRQHYSLNRDIILKQDEDVLDTWFSSALWPFVTLGWPKATKELEIFYPTNVLVTGFDIIFFWVARMLMLGLHFTGKVPFKEVYVTGLIRDHEGQKMSKSKGNVLDPLDIVLGISADDLVMKRTQGLLQPQMAKKIEKTTRQQFPQGISPLGTDALRFTYCALASPTRDIRFDLNRTEGYRNFCNKLWNASRFVLIHTEKQEKLSSLPKLTLPINRAFYSLLQNTITDMHRHFQDYRFDLMAQTIYEFIWNEYCDWYVELSKPVLSLNTSISQETLTCLIVILETCLRLLHPLMPFITEEIWQAIAPITGKKGRSLMIQAYPQFDKTKKDVNAEKDLSWLKAIVQTIRALRSEMNISPGKKIPLLFYKGDKKDRQNIQVYLKDIMNLAKISETLWVAEKEKNAAHAIAIVGNLELLIPIQGLINTEVEVQRLKKEILKIEKEIKKAESKLANPAFIKKAPSNIITQEQQRLVDFTAMHNKLKNQLNSFKV